LTLFNTLPTQTNRKTISSSQNYLKRLLFFSEQVL